MYRKGLFSSAVLFTICVGATAATAQDFSAAISFGTGSVAVEGMDRDLPARSIDVAFDADFGNGLVLGGDISGQRLDVGSFFGSVETSLFAIDGHYRLDNGVTFGAYAQRIRIDSFREMEVSSQGVTLGYDAGRWGIEAFTGRSDFGSRGIEARDYGVIGYARPNDRLTLGAAVMRSDIDVTDRDPTLVRLAAVYDLSDTVTVFGGVDALSLNEEDIYTVGLGLGYDLTRVIGYPAVLSVEFTHQSVNEMKMDGIEFAMTIPLGRVADKAPLGSVAGHALRSKRSALNGLYDNGVPLF